MTKDGVHPKVACPKFVFLPQSEVFIAEQLKALRRYDPFVLAVSAPDRMGLPAERIRALGDLHPLRHGTNRLLLKLGRVCPYFEGEVRRAGCRLIHAQFGTEGLYGIRLKARTRLPLVTSFLGYDASRLPRRHPELYRQLFAEGDLFLACAEAIRERLLEQGCPGERLRVHHLGVDLERIPFSERVPDDDRRANVLLVGRMVEKKGIPFAVRAFADVRRDHPRIRLTLIGDGPQRAAIEALLRELNLSDVRMLSAQPHAVVLSEMKRAHMFVLPSVTAADGDMEGIPVTLMEAQASGLPVIASHHSGNPELVDDGRSGYLVPERDTHALAERMRHLVEHPEVWGAFAHAGRAIVEERFNLQRQVAALEGCYDELLVSSAAG